MLPTERAFRRLVGDEAIRVVFAHFRINRWNRRDAARDLYNYLKDVGIKPVGLRACEVYAGLHKGEEQLYRRRIDMEARGEREVYDY